MRKVAVFFGGKSCENEISVLTGVFVLNLLDREKYIPVPIYVHTDGGFYTSSKMFELETFKKQSYSDFDRIFLDGGTVYAFNAKKKRIKRLYKIDAGINCCHGGLGEGGGISALAAHNGIPLASPPLTPSGIFMDKSCTKLIAKALNIPTLDYIRVNENDYKKRGAFLLKSIESRLKYPVVVKPAHLGSSIGIAVARNEEEIKRAVETAFALDDRVIVEKYLEEKKDVNCAAYMRGGEIFVSEPETAFGDGLYTFEEKYEKRERDGEPIKRTNQRGRYALSNELTAKIRAYTKTLYKRADLFGAVRMDFLVSEGKAYLCEVNTVPGSLAYYLFCERLSDARTFFGDLIEEAVERKGQGEKKLVRTGILKRTRLQGK